MYPLLFGVEWLDMYMILIAVGLISGLMVFKFNCGKLKIADKPYNFYAITAIISIFGGFIFAMLFNNLYKAIEAAVTKTKFEWGGMTFLGGLIGGVVTFILITAIFGSSEVKAEFWTIANLAAPTTLLAHAFGRLGCYCAPCCWGRETDSIFGVTFPGHKHAVYPTQLFEAIFLFIMFAVTMLMLYKFKKKDYLLFTYCFSYAIFRFLIEFLRGDDRGVLIPGISLSPSQIQSIVLFITGLIMLYIVQIKKHIPFQKKPPAS